MQLLVTYMHKQLFALNYKVNFFFFLVDHVNKLTREIRTVSSFLFSYCIICFNIVYFFSNIMQTLNAELF